MLVKYWMNKNPVTIDAHESMEKAVNLMKRHDVRLLPVMQSSRLAGVVTDRDIKRASASDATSLEIHELLYLVAKIKVAEIMSQPVITVPWDYTIEEAAETLLQHKISGAPVVDHGGMLKGIITQNDLFRALVSLTGLRNRGFHFGLYVEDRPGSIMDVANLIRSAGGRMVSILSSYERCAEGFRRLYMRVYGLDRSRLDALLKQIEGKARLLYMVDHRENRREIFAE